MTKIELNIIFSYIDSFCTVNIHLMKSNPTTLPLDDIIFQNNSKQRIQLLLKELQLTFNLSISTSITVIEAYLTRSVLLNAYNDYDKDNMFTFVERFIGWLRQFDGGNKYKDKYVKEWRIKPRHNRFGYLPHSGMQF